MCYCWVVGSLGMDKAGLETQQEEMMMVERYQSEQKQKV